VGWKDSDATAAFAAGKAAMLPMLSPAAMATLDKSAMKGHYTFAPLPTVAMGMSQRPANASPAGSIVSGQNISIASYTKNKDLALSFIDLVTSTDGQLARHKAFGDLPTNQEALSQVAKDNPLLAPVAGIEKNSTPTSFTGAWADVQNGVLNVVVQSLPSLARGSYDKGAVKSLLDQAGAKAQSALDRANR
jgi:multiple sugar transport system substrate-binding protein